MFCSTESVTKDTDSVLRDVTLFECGILIQDYEVAIPLDLGESP